jgi:hypothetical protein
LLLKFVFTVKKPNKRIETGERIEKERENATTIVKWRIWRERERERER